MWGVGRAERRGGKDTRRIGAKRELVDGRIEVAWATALSTAGLFAVREGGGAARGSTAEFGTDVKLSRGCFAGNGEMVACAIGCGESQ